MKTGRIVLAASIILLAACAPRNAEREASQKLIRENEERLASLENSVSALNTQISQLNNRVYEVRNRNGQKTSMTVVPVNQSEATPPVATPVAPKAAPAPKPTPKPKAQPQGRKVNPQAQPAPLPAKGAPKTAAASGRIGSPANAQGPSGHIGDNSELALPPSDLPTSPMTPEGTDIPVPQGNVSSPVETPQVPVPLVPTSDISLPPEQPVAAPAPRPAAQAKSAPAAQNRQAPAKRASGRQGEKAAYNAALNAARSGRTAEGIQKFRDFLQKYPNGPYAANAEYWIGECLYAQGKYKEALSEFQGVNNSYPSHHKNADALLKAGMTLNKMGDSAGASEKFRALIANFPNSEAARRARAMGVK